jgi:2,3-bisphosphoglycerate-independent phosphoglycerate mutase
MRCILIILDGLGDRGHQCLGGKTPLQYAYTPNMDHIAELGMNGLYHAYIHGVPMPSETAHFLMFGYDIEDFPGRGLLEGVGYGVEIRDDDVAVLAHICSVERKDKHLVLVDERPRLQPETAQQLIDSISRFGTEDINIRFCPTKGIDGVLVLEGDVSPFITDSNPIYEGRPMIDVYPLKQAAKDPKAQKTAEALKNYLLWAHNNLSHHPINQERNEGGMLPINAVVTQRAGQRRMIPSFYQGWGLKGISISAGAIYWGLCQEIGMDVSRAKDSGNPEADIRNRLLSAKDLPPSYDFIHVHTKVPDEAAHTKDPWNKVRAIEALDKGMDVVVSDILKDPEILLILTSDHSTPSSRSMIHSGETVPITFVNKDVRRDRVKSFDEVSCATGALGMIRGKELMYLIVNYMDRGKLKGLMDTPVDQPYYSGHYRPLVVEE